ncbi:MAG: hypothetical protein ACI9KN_000285 [Gammaproteobacteria bacterium]|jgi:hypothetical protein
MHKALRETGMKTITMLITNARSQIIGKLLSDLLDTDAVRYINSVD